MRIGCHAAQEDRCDGLRDNVMEEITLIRGAQERKGWPVSPPRRKRAPLPGSGGQIERVLAGGPFLPSGEKKVVSADEDGDETHPYVTAFFPSPFFWVDKGRPDHPLLTQGAVLSGLYRAYYGDID